jgi:3-deoxy-D-manno-octulosonate 8-phosphate phosphatase (KDO 8-P phosphatase)
MPLLSLNEFHNRCSSIRTVVSDVDGTLTDGGMYYSVEGNAMKRFSAHDGMGVTLLMDAGIEVVFLSSECTPIISSRAEKLGVKNVYQGIHDKVHTLRQVVQQFGILYSEIAYIGDDVNDIHALQLCGLSVCPADAVPEVRAVAHYVCSKEGGHGAFRELATHILTAQKLPTYIL